MKFRLAAAFALLSPVIFVSFILFDCPSLHATQNPKMSLDVTPADNSYDPVSNVMSVGQVDNCLTHNDATSNSQHTHLLHLVLQDAENLLTWQARLSWDPNQIESVVFNPAPFAGGVSFLNLPIDADTGGHRAIAAYTEPNPPAGSRLFAAQYANTGENSPAPRTEAVSPDTPYINDEPTRTYDAPTGGVVATFVVTVKAGHAGEVLRIGLVRHGEDGMSGSKIETLPGPVYTTTLVPEVSPAFIGEGTACVPFTPSPTPSPVPSPNPTPTPAPSPSPGPTPLSDSDGDGFSDQIEAHVGTNPLANCGRAAWPPDFNDDLRVNTADLNLVKAHLGEQVPPAPIRFDIGPDPLGDGFIDITDISRAAAYDGQRCTLSLPDSDGDGFSDSLELHIGTNPLDACGAGAWPPDINNDTFVDISDMNLVTSKLGQTSPPAPVRYDIAPEPIGDNVINSSDTDRINDFFSRSCGSP